MKKLLRILALSLLICNISFSTERSKDEIKNGVFLEDLKDIIGIFQEINSAPKEMFKSTGSFIKMSKYSQSKMALIFVKQKNMLDKFPEKMMWGMGYFEFFYMQQLKDNRKQIRTFREDYPEIRTDTRVAMKKIYSLSKARKAMREALGFSINDDVQDVLITYNVLAKMFAQGEKNKIKLNSEEKKKFKEHSKLAKNLGVYRNLMISKKENRVTKKDFDKEHKKIKNKINKNIANLDKYAVYAELGSLINEVNDIADNKMYLKTSGVNLVEYILKEIKKKNIKKRYEIDLTNADFSLFTKKELIILSEISTKMKNTQIIKANKIQTDILNLVNDNFPANTFLNNFKKSDVILNDLNMEIKNSTIMNKWAMKDWANAWKKSFPTRIKNTNGDLIDLTQGDIESIKAQLSIEHISSLLKNDDIGNIIADTQIFSNLDIDQTNFEFSFGLNDYANFLGDFYGWEVNNYDELTNLANETYNANWTPEEYASAYQVQVDIVNALQSGEVGDFDAASIGAAIGASLDEAVEVIAAAGAAGVSVDLEAAAQGLGYDSFSAAVDAYNAANGTNYTDAQAREALGQ